MRPPLLLCCAILPNAGAGLSRRTIRAKSKYLRRYTLRPIMILQDIVASTKERVAREMNRESLRDIEARLQSALDARPALAPRPFAARLRHPNRLGLIAEIKKASPSRGLIAPGFDVEKQAAIYRDALADCLSVLTEPKYFQGELSHLSQAREVSGKPVIRKDFIISDWQIAQARLAGADCILLIMAILSDWELRCFKALAHRYQMDALVEVHTEEQPRPQHLPG